MPRPRRRPVARPARRCRSTDDGDVGMAWLLDNERDGLQQESFGGRIATTGLVGWTDGDFFQGAGGGRHRRQPGPEQPQARRRRVGGVLHPDCRGVGEGPRGRAPPQERGRAVEARLRPQHPDPQRRQHSHVTGGQARRWLRLVRAPRTSATACAVSPATASSLPVEFAAVAPPSCRGPCGAGPTKREERRRRTTEERRHEFTRGLTGWITLYQHRQQRSCRHPRRCAAVLGWTFQEPLRDQRPVSITSSPTRHPSAAAGCVAPRPGSDRGPRRACTSRTPSPVSMPPWRPVPSRWTADHGDGRRVRRARPAPAACRSGLPPDRRRRKAGLPLVEQRGSSQTAPGSYVDLLSRVPAGPSPRLVSRQTRTVAVGRDRPHQWSVP